MTVRLPFTHLCALFSMSVHPSSVHFNLYVSVFCLYCCLPLDAHTHTLSLAHTHTHLYSRDLILIKSARAHVWGTTSACTLVRPNVCTQAPAHHTWTMPCRHIHGLLKLLEYWILLSILPPRLCHAIDPSLDTATSTMPCHRSSSRYCHLDYAMP